jgi:hypothetical protein
VPEIQKYIDLYNGNPDKIEIEKFNRKISTGCSAIRNITQNYFHLSTWDFQEFKQYLLDAGFKNIKEMTFNESQDEKPKIFIEERFWETLYIEVSK